MSPTTTGSSGDHCSDPPQVGQCIGNFRLERLLGQGGMGTVFKATDLSLDRTVAIKFLTLAGGRASADMALSAVELRFVREAQLMARVNHPHIIPVYAASLEHRFPYFVMEYIGGMTLDDYIDARGPLSIGKICFYGAQIVDALRFAWEHHHVIHRDLKPENVIFVNAHHLKLLDLGIAKCLDEDLEITTVSAGANGLGTPYYASPEQFVGDDDVDQRSDIYSLGLMMWEMVCGDSVFPNVGSLNGLLACKLNGPQQSLRDRGVPTRLRKLLESMVALDPAKRMADYAVIEDVLNELAQRYMDHDLASRVIARGRRDDEVQLTAPTATPRLSPEPAVAMGISTHVAEPQLDDTVAMVSSTFASASELRAVDEIRAALSPGMTVAGYRVGECIGVGGLGLVYRGVELASGADVALKFLRIPVETTASEQLTLIEQQTARVRSMDHSGIVHSHGCFHCNGFVFAVSDLFVGPHGKPVNLEDYSRRFGAANGILAEDDLQAITLAVLGALEHAHERGVVHCDLKPQNVLLHCMSDQHDHWSAQVRITDFGVAPLIGEPVVLQSVRRSMNDVAAGGLMSDDVQALLDTYEYMSPEQRAGNVGTVASDLYAVGLMVYRFLTGRGQLGVGKLPSQVRTDIGAGWDDVVVRATLDSARERFASAIDMAAAVVQAARSH